MSEISKAVFLSYASQDSDAARRIAEALRAADIEVWFDQSELVGGDAWDQKIRKQIKDCALLIPIISAATQARTEGYFRLEWRLADQRTHLMAKGRPFLLPVVIDGTRDTEAHVPDSFTEVQWTRLPGGETPPKFCERVKKLLGGEAAGTTSRDDQPGESRQYATPATMGTPRWLRPVLAGAVVAAIVLAVTLKVKLAEGGRAPTVPAQRSEVQQLLDRAAVLSAEKPNLVDPSREDLDAAAKLIAQAQTLDPLNGEVWAADAFNDQIYISLVYDPSDARKAQVATKSARAMQLSPRSYAARRARAFALVETGMPTTRPEAEKMLRVLHAERPGDADTVIALGGLLMDEGRMDEAADLLLKAKVPYLAGLALTLDGRWPQADAAADQALALGRTVKNLEFKCWVELCGFEDIEAARLYVSEYPPSALQEDLPANSAIQYSLQFRNPEKVLEVVRSFPGDWISTWNYITPKMAYAGWADEMAGRMDAARAEWRVALQVVERKLGETPNAPALLLLQARLLVDLGQKADAERQFRLYQQLKGQGEHEITMDNFAAALRLGRRDEVMAWLIAGLRDPKRDHFRLHALARFHFDFDPLRGDPEFEKLLRDTLPKDAKPFPDQKRKDSEQNAVSASDEKSLVVLPLENLSPDPADAFFTDGIHSEIISTLSRVTDLKVISRTTALAFKGTNLSLTEISRKLGVANVIAGSVRRAGNRVRIELELRRASDEALLWQSPKADRELKDIFDLQSDIADEVARALQARVAPGTNAGARFFTKNTAAYDLFLKGSTRFFSAEEGSFDQAIDFYSHALELDPNFATAAFMLAAAHCNLFNKTSDFAVRVHHAAEARKWAEEAARLSPGDAGASAQAFYFLLVEQDYPRALAMADKALLALPNETGTNSIRAFALSNLGREREALAGLNVALELDPLNRFCIINYWMSLLRLRRATELRAEIARVEASPVGKDGFYHWAAVRAFYQLDGTVPETIPENSGPKLVEWAWRGRRFAEGAALVTKLLGDAALGAPDHFTLQLYRHAALQRLGRESEAATVAQDLMKRALQMQAATEIGPSAKDGWMAQALARQGDAEGAVLAGRRYVEATPADRYASQRWQREWELAGLLAYLHRTKESVALLGGLLRVPSGLTVARLRVDPDFDNLRDDPAFQALLADSKNSEPL